MDIYHFAGNVAAALAMGMIIGLERQVRQHTAGLRTNALVCVAAALFVSLSMLVEHESSPTRVAGQVASGIGFLGGGVILREGFNVRGMNTAATLWCSAAIGTLAGAGRLTEGAVGTVLVLISHIVLRPLTLRLEASLHLSHTGEGLYRVHLTSTTAQEAMVRQLLMRHVNSEPGMAIHGLSTQEAAPGMTTVNAEVYVAERNDKFFNELVSRLSIEQGVSAVSWERRT